MSTPDPGRGAPHGLEPSSWITRYAHLVPAGVRVLDLACGTGRHARFFAERGCRVLAVDRDAAALAGMKDIAGIETRAADLESGIWPFAGEHFGAIVVTHYLHRPLFPHLRAALAEDGALLYETFARGNEAFGRPSNPHFLLEPDELLRLCGAPLTVVAFEQGCVDQGGKPAVVQRIAALLSVHRGPPWLVPP